MRILTQLFALAVFSMSTQFANAGALEDFRLFLSGTQSGRAEFTQTVTDIKGKVSPQASGTLIFVRPGKFRFQYIKPAQQIVSDGKSVSFFDVDLNQVTVKKVEAAFASTPAALFAGKSEVEAAFTLINGGESGGIVWLNAEPKSKEEGIKQVRVGFKNGQLGAIELHDSFENRTLITFTKFERNPKIDAKEFVFIAPKGADVFSDIAEKK